MVARHQRARERQQPMSHSKIVGGSTAERVINCPGSVALAAKMPPQVENEHMAAGTKLHDLIADLVFAADDQRAAKLATLPDDQADKLRTALALFDTHVDPDLYFEGDVEAHVDFPWDRSIFGTADVIGKIGERSIVLDWKFGDGVMVDAKENYQLLFYAAAAWYSGLWAFQEPEEVELIIIQPPHIRRWVTNVDRLERFNDELAKAVSIAKKPDAPIVPGDHCRFCPAKAICPQKTGAAERAVVTAIDTIGPEQIGHWMTVAAQLEDWAADVRKLTQRALENNIPVPGWKLVNKRAQRAWVNQDDALATLTAAAPGVEVTELKSPAQVEKTLKAHGYKMPEGLTSQVSSGLTIAEEADSRPAAVTIGSTLVSALSKLR